MSLMQQAHLVCVVLYCLTLGILAIYGIHRYVQVFLYYKHSRHTPKPAGAFETLPRVTVQLPMYNEEFVAARIIEAACKIDYPSHLLQIQVLDDSTDNSAILAKEACDRMRRLGHDVEYVHRVDRIGYKAGALEQGLKTATGEFVAIFDADFVPNPDVIRQTIHFFTDPNVGCVQSRWGHINREQSILTRCQAIFLDGHFMIEHTARNRSGRFMNFNGTAGIWRKKAIEDSGGWQHDTLTEDMDLSFRSQLRGWQFIFVADLVCPAELPPEVIAFKQQQHRWTKGSVQTAIKLLPTVLRSKLPLRVKVESWFHLTSAAVYVPAVILSLLLFPTWAMQTDIFYSTHILVTAIVMSFFGLLTCSAGTFYMLSQQAIGRSTFKTFLMIPMLMALGMGISMMNGLAVLEGLFGRKDTEFIRTPKYGTSAGKNDWKRRAGTFRKKSTWLPFVEIFFGLYMTACLVVACITGRAFGTVPFLAIFAFGYLYVGLMTFHSRWLSRRAKESTPLPVPVPAAEAVAA